MPAKLPSAVVRKKTQLRAVIFRNVFQSLFVGRDLTASLHESQACFLVGGDVSRPTFFLRMTNSSHRIRAVFIGPVHFALQSFVIDWCCCLDLNF